MKTKEIMLFIIIGVVSGVFAIIVSNMILSGENNRSENVEVVPVITSELVRPPKNYFNENAINPTLTIEISEEGNQKPFGTNE